MIWRNLILLIVTMISVSVGSYSALAALFKGWRFDPNSNQLEFILDAGVTPRYFVLTEPPRIVIDLPDTEFRQETNKQNYAGLIRQIRVSQFQEGVTRLVLELSSEAIISPEGVRLQQLETNSQESRWRLSPSITQKKISPSSVSTTALPPATLPTNSTGITVSVPSLNSQIPTTNSNNQKPKVDVPTNQTQTRPSSTPTPSSTVSSSVIDFGQPLPNASSTTNGNGTIESGVILNRGTKLSLRYVGRGNLTLKPGDSRQEVLLLETEILDRNGQAIVKTGTPVIGRFATDNRGIHFITQAIALETKNKLLKARSTPLQSSVNNRANIVTIEPGFSLQVELTEDWRY